MQHSALNYALWLLGRRDRSVGEIEKRLKDKEYSSEEIKGTIHFLDKKKFLDDTRFAQNYIKNQLLIKPQGKYQLKLKLNKKLVPDDIIDKTLEEINEEDERDQMKEAAEKWRKSKYKVLSIKYQGDKNKIKNSLVRYLISRGFGWDLIKEAIDATINKY